MSLKPESPSSIPEDTARLVRSILPKGNTVTRLCDAFGALFRDEDFADLFPRRGQPTLSPWRLAMVTVLQFMENLTDRQAAEAVRLRVDWKYALALPLDDQGFDYSVLSEFRSRLLAGGAEALLFDAVLERLKEKGLIKSRGKQRTDSTHVLALARDLSRLEMVGETLRAALNELARAAPDWLRAVARPEWWERYGHRVEEYRLPQSATERQRQATLIGEDGYELMGHVDADVEAESLRTLPQVQHLRLVWEQQYERVGEESRLRDPSELPPGAQRPSSPYEPECRASVKRDTKWVGYKVHLSESCDAELPHLITDVRTTPAPMQDVICTAPIQTALIEKGLPPAEHLADSGYVSAANLADSRKRGIRLIGPPRPNTSWQARTEGAYDASHFTIDWEAWQAICPQGRRSVSWAPTLDRYGRACIVVRFSRDDCAPCPARALCTKAKIEARQLKLHPREANEAQRAAQHNEEEAYPLRAGIESAFSQGVRRFGLRQARYRGIAKTHLQNLAVASAMNLGRATDWLTGVRPPQRPQPHFAALMA